jgi:hypothetical protein
MDKKQKRRHPGKVIRFFTVEVASSGSDPVLDSNSCNPYSLLSEEERVKDLVEIFGLLWAESCRKSSQNDVASKELS